MSTSSGRDGYCERCGHLMNEHARHTRCRKCKKNFDICQVNSHGSDGLSRGWRICHIPCNCGRRYYPDKATTATLLQSHEYVPDHPGYRAEDNSIISNEEEARHGSGSIGEASTSHRSRTFSQGSEDPLRMEHDLENIMTQLSISDHTRFGTIGSHGRSLSQDSEDVLSKTEAPMGVDYSDAVYVDAYWHDTEQIRFKLHDGTLLSSHPRDWSEGQMDYQGSPTHCWQYWSKGKFFYYTWEIGDAEQAASSKHRDKGKKGKGRRR